MPLWGGAGLLETFLGQPVLFRQAFTFDTGSPASFALTLQLLALSRGAQHLSTDTHTGCKRKTHLELLRDQGVSGQPREAAPLEGMSCLPFGKKAALTHQQRRRSGERARIRPSASSGVPCSKSLLALPHQEHRVTPLP